MMKIVVKTVVVCLLTMVSVPLIAQVGFGIKGGLNLSTLKVDNPEASYKSRTGYHAGIFLRGKFDKVAIQPEVLLFTQSNEVDFSGGFGSVKESFTYISVPVIFKFYPVFGLNLQIGPQFGFLVDGEQEFNTLLFTGTQDITESYKKSDISISLGGGWDLPFGLVVDVRYNIGIKDINDTSDGEEAKSRVFLVSLGWNFAN